MGTPARSMVIKSAKSGQPTINATRRIGMEDGRRFRVGIRTQ